MSILTGKAESDADGPMVLDEKGRAILTILAWYVDRVQERADLWKMMGDQSSEYWKGPNADANQSRYRELILLTDGQPDSTR